MAYTLQQVDCDPLFPAWMHGLTGKQLLKAVKGCLSLSQQRLSRMLLTVPVPVPPMTIPARDVSVRDGLLFTLCTHHCV